MPFVGALILLIQIGFAIHVIRTGRETFWLYIIMFIPALGCAIYFFTQVLPDLQGSHAVRKAGNRLLKAVDPERELRRRKDELAMADTVDNRIKLADECLEAGFNDEAIGLLEKCCRAGHEDDPDILLMLAKAQFQAKQYPQTLQTLDRLIASNPGFRSHDGHLLYARSLEETRQYPQALEEYAALVSTYPGEEARARYALLLQQRGQTEKAKAICGEVIQRSKRSPAFYRRKEKPWIKMAEQLLAEMA